MTTATTTQPQGLVSHLINGDVTRKLSRTIGNSRLYWKVRVGDRDATLAEILTLSALTGRGSLEWRSRSMAVDGVETGRLIDGGWAAELLTAIQSEPECPDFPHGGPLDLDLLSSRPLVCDQPWTDGEADRIRAGFQRLDDKETP